MSHAHRLIVFLSAFVLAVLVGLPHTKNPPYVGILPIGTDAAEVNLGRFYANLQRSYLYFYPGQTGQGMGAFSLLRGNAPVAPAVQESAAGRQIATYRAHQGDRACIAGICTELTGNLLLATDVGPDGTFWTTRAAWIRADVPANAPLSFSSSKPVRLVVADGGDHRIQAAELVPGTIAEVDFTDLGTRSVPKLVYLFVFATIIGLLALALYRDLSSKDGSIILGQPVFFASALLICTVYYYIVFPGFFNADHLVAVVNEGTYTSWYSPFYMVYSYLVSFLGNRFIQLPAVAGVLVSVLILSLAIRQSAIKGALAARAYLLLTLILNPIVFVLMFCAQRQFVALVCVLLGVALVAAGLADIATVARRRDWRAYWFGIGFLGAATLMRPEYGLLLAAVAGFAPMLGTPRGRLSTIATIALPLVVVGLGTLALNKTLPRLYNENLHNETRVYRLASIIDRLGSYVRCDPKRQFQQNPEIAVALQPLGGIDSYCALGSSVFFWKKVRPLKPQDAAVFNREISRALRHAVTANPTPAIRSFMVRTANLFVQPIWQVFDQYQFRLQPPTDPDKPLYDLDRAVHFVDTFDPHIANADKMGLVMDRPEVATLHGWLLKGFDLTNKPFNFWIFGSGLAVFLLLPLLLRRLPLSLAMNAAVGLTTLAVIVASPASNWAYIGLVPVWATLAYPFAMLEWAARRKRAAGEALSPQPTPEAPLADAAPATGV